MTIVAHRSEGSTFSPAQIAYGVIFASGSGAIVASCFTPIGPLGGAIFGAAYLASCRLVSLVWDRISSDPDNPVLKVAKVAAMLIGGIIGSSSLTSLLGYSITFLTGTFLTAGMVVVTLSALLAMGGCLFSSVMFTGIMLHSNESALNRV